MELEKRQIFWESKKLSESDLDHLTDLWLHVFGNNKAKHTNGNHYFLQEILEHGEVNWKLWQNKLHPELREIILSKYPQLTK